MIRYLLLLIYFTSSLSYLHSQSIPKNDEGKYEYTEVKNIKGVAEENLFSTAKSWLNASFPEESLQIDEEKSQLVQDASMKVNLSIYAGIITYRYTINVRDGQFSYSVTDFYHESNRSAVGSGGALENDIPECGLEEMKQGIWDDINEYCRLQMEIEIIDFKNKMSSLGDPEKYK